MHPEELSAVLTQGLPPVPDTLVGEVAASFEDLEAVRNDLARLREAAQAVDDFCPVYRSYLRTVSRSRAEALLDAVLSSRRARSRLAQSHQALEQAVADLDETNAPRKAGRLLTQTEERLRAASNHRPSGTRRRSSRWTNRHPMPGSRRRSRPPGGGGDPSTQRGAASESERAAGELRAAEAEVDRQFSDTARAADAAGVSSRSRRERVPHCRPGYALRSPATFRLDEISQVRRAIETSCVATERADDAEDRAGTSRHAAEEASSLRHSAERELDGAVASLVAAVRAWCGSTGVLTPDERQLFVEVAAEGGAAAVRTSPTLTEVAKGLFGPKRRDLDVALAHIGNRRQKTADQRERLVDERNRVADDPLPAPDRLTVRPADRTGRAGAPLFACCDFRDGVADHDRSGIEAALHAAGLLDAWVSADRSGSDAPPDGTELDAWLTAGPETDGPTLDDVLTADPAEDSGLGPDAVTAVLRSIPCPTRASAYSPTAGSRSDRSEGDTPSLRRSSSGPRLGRPVGSDGWPSSMPW